MTDMTMKDLEQAETDQRNLLMQLKHEKETLVSECKALNGTYSFLKNELIEFSARGTWALFRIILQCKVIES